MTNRNDIPLPLDDILAEECRESARLIALQYADLMQSLSESNLDLAYALIELMGNINATAYQNDLTTSTANAFSENLLNDDMIDLILFDAIDIPIKKYFSI